MVARSYNDAIIIVQRVTFMQSSKNKEEQGGTTRNKEEQ
jgi:hypothetical protein